MPKIIDCNSLEGRYIESDGACGTQYRQAFLKGEQYPIGFTFNGVDPGGNTKNHSHDGYHFTYVVEGSGELRVGDAVYPVAKGQLVYLEPFEPHCYYNTGDQTLLLLGIQG